MLPILYAKGSTNAVLTHGSQCCVFVRRGAERLTLDTDSGARGLVAKQSTHGASGMVLAAAFSPSGKLFALTTDCKQLLVFATDTWRRLHEFQVAKKGVVLLFPISDDAILIADKFGDVYRFPLTNAAAHESPVDVATASAATCGELVLGHLSMILDATFLGDGKYLATCDRDEKIRVTRYPQSYDIQSYCLGHTKMVTRLLPLRLSATTDGHHEVLLSGGADGSLRLWNYLTGEQLACVGATSCSPRAPPAGDAAIVSSLHWVPGRQTAVATFEGEPLLVVLRVESAGAAAGTDRRHDDSGSATASVAASATTTALGHPSMHCVQTVVLDVVPWCVHVHGDDVLVLQPRSDRPLLAFAFGPDGVLHEAGQQQRADEEGELFAWLEAALRHEWPALSSYGGGGDFYSKLEKMGVDNLPDYLHKKRERLRAAKERREAPRQQEAARAEETIGAGPPAKLCKS